jgi:hypothetical protein
MLLFPVIYLLINLVLVDTVMNGLKGLTNDTASWDKTIKTVHGYTFPIFLELGFIVSGGLYIITFMKDRFDSLRYILNFTGIRPVAYILGL